MGLVCEHPRTITAGIQTDPDNLLVDREFLNEQKIAFHSIRRGGDLTAHEPGQIVIYPHVDLLKRKFAVSKYFRSLAAVTSDALFDVWAIETVYRDETPGLYLKSGEKLASIGIQFKSFFTGHGIAINVSNDLETFRYIHPCGNKSIKMTGIVQLGLDETKQELFKRLWIDRFAMELSRQSAPQPAQSPAS